MILLENIFDPNNFLFWILILGVLGGIIAYVFRTFLAYFKFVYPNAKFEAMGNPFLTEKELTRLLNSKDLTNFKELLNASRDYNIVGDNSYELQNSLDNQLFLSIEMMRKDSSKKMYDFFDIYLARLLHQLM